MRILIFIVTLSFLFGQLFYIKLTLVFALINQIMTNLDCLIGVEHSLFMLMNLTQQSTNLHMGFASVLKHL